MKSLESVISARESQLAQYKSDQLMATDNIAEFIKATNEIKPDHLISAVLMPEFNAYADCAEALELGQLPAYKARKMTKAEIKAERLRLWEKIQPLASVPVFQEDMPDLQNFVEAMIVRKKKLRDNYSISITKAQKDILLYKLMLSVDDKPELQPEGYADFKRALLFEPEKKPAGKLPPFKPEAGWTIPVLVKACIDATGKEDWGVIGKALEYYQLKPGAGGKLVSA